LIKIPHAVLRMMAVSVIISGACVSETQLPPGTGGKPGSGGATGSGGSNGSGGATGTGGKAASGGAVGTGGSTSGSGSGGAGGSCPNVTPCGGNVVGTWSVTSSCLQVTGTLDPALVGATDPGCPRPQVTGSLKVTGTWKANANGTLLDDTTVTGDEHFSLDPKCLVISSTPVLCTKVGGLYKAALGFDSVDCTEASDGKCACSATVQQTGGLGLPAGAPTTTGNYSTKENTLTVTGDSDAKYSYCVSGTALTVTPQTESPTVAGTIVLQQVGVSGSGGMAGSAGAKGSGGTTGSGGQGGSKGSGGSIGTAGNGGGLGPCDIYKSGGNPCVAAHSTVRAMFGAYSGKLYQIRNAAGTTKDITTLSPGGIADGASQETFCSGTTCVVTVLYDQSGKGNDLWYQGSTMVAGSTSSKPSNAMKEPLTVGGHRVYSLYIDMGNSYWVDASKSGIALGKEPEGMYMVTSGKHSNGGCCFDYGNSETDRKADGSGAMDAVNFSSITSWGTGAGKGPWVMADLEYGVFADDDNNAPNMNNPTQTAAYITAILKNDGVNEFALRGGDATAPTLGTYYKGKLPGGWSPMKKQGAIILGSGGDCCKPGGGANQSIGTFYEGCVVTGYPSDATENAVQANIAAAGYGK
jgi:hypothetical protein